MEWRKAAALSLRGIRLHQGSTFLSMAVLLWNYQEQYYSGRGAETASISARSIRQGGFGF